MVIGLLALDRGLPTYSVHWLKELHTRVRPEDDLRQWVERCGAASPKPPFVHSRCNFRGRGDREVRIAQPLSILRATTAPRPLWTIGPLV